MKHLIAFYDTSVYKHLMACAKCNDTKTILIKAGDIRIKKTCQCVFDRVHLRKTLESLAWFLEHGTEEDCELINNALKKKVAKFEIDDPDLKIELKTDS